MNGAKGRVVRDERGGAARAQLLLSPVSHCEDFGFYSEGDGSHWRVLSREMT